MTFYLQFNQIALLFYECVCVCVCHYTTSNGLQRGVLLCFFFSIALSLHLIYKPFLAHHSVSLFLFTQLFCWFVWQIVCVRKTYININRNNQNFTTVHIAHSADIQRHTDKTYTDKEIHRSFRCSLINIIYMYTYLNTQNEPTKRNDAYIKAGIVFV